MAFDVVELDVLTLGPLGTGAILLTSVAGETDAGAFCCPLSGGA